MSFVGSGDDDAWWDAVEQEVAPKNLSLRCQDIVFRMTQSLASKDYSAVLYAFTVCPLRKISKEGHTGPCRDAAG
jgi:hypothetical protein